MANVRATYQFLTYNPDRGVDPIPNAARGSLVVPVGITPGQIETLLNTAGGQLIKFNGQVINDLPAPPCPDSKIFTPRKLIFTLANGVSMSVPVAVRTSLTSVMAAGIVALEGLSTVVCVKYVGEKWRNLLEIFGQSGKAVTPSINDPRGFTLAGAYTYNADSTNPFGGAIPKNFKVASEARDAIPAILANVWTASAGVQLPASSVISCRTGTRHNHRRYIATALIDRNGVTRPTKIEIPVAASGAGDIRTAGELIAALPSVACLEYQGESYDRFHKLVP
jgi:hypothetical protein